MIHASPKHPVIRFINGKWELQKEVIIYWETFTFVIHKGYRCDLGSVPWFFHWAVSPTKRGVLGFLAHDWVYDDDCPLPKDPAGAEMSRYQADYMMRDFLLFAGMAKWRANMALRGVRSAGMFSFKRND